VKEFTEFDGIVLGCCGEIGLLLSSQTQNLLSALWFTVQVKRWELTARSWAINWGFPNNCLLITSESSSTFLYHDICQSKRSSTLTKKCRESSTDLPATPCEDPEAFDGSLDFCLNKSISPDL